MLTGVCSPCAKSGPGAVRWQIWNKWWGLLHKQSHRAHPVSLIGTPGLPSLPSCSAWIPFFSAHLMRHWPTHCRLGPLAHLPLPSALPEDSTAQQETVVVKSSGARLRSIISGHSLCSINVVLSEWMDIQLVNGWIQGLDGISSANGGFIWWCDYRVPEMTNCPVNTCCQLWVMFDAVVSYICVRNTYQIYLVDGNVSIKTILNLWEQCALN